MSMMPRCFVSMPFGEKFTPIRNFMMSVLREHKIDTLMYEDYIAPGGDWAVLTVHQMIARADFVVADLTFHRPNVLYEVGLADGMDKPVLLIMQQHETHIPS